MSESHARKRGRIRGLLPIGLAAALTAAIVVGWFLFPRGGTRPTAAWSSDDVFLAAGNGNVIGESPAGLISAYPIDCREPCSPTWSAPVRGSDLQGPVWANSRVGLGHNVAYTLTPQGTTWNSDILLRAFALDCSGTCSPDWTATFPKEDPRPILWSLSPTDGGVLLATSAEDGSELMAFNRQCREVCTPSWTASLRGGGVSFVGSTDSSAVAISSGREPRVEVFPISCAPTNGVCDPAWQWPVGGRVMSASIAGDQLFLVSDRLHALEVCSKGAACGHTWSAKVPSRFRGETRYSIVVGDAMVAVSRSGTNLDDLVVYRRDCDQACRPAWTATGVAGLAFSGDDLLAASGRPVGVNGLIEYFRPCPEDGRVCQPTWTAHIPGWGEEAITDETAAYVSAQGLETATEEGGKSVYAYVLACAGVVDATWTLTATELASGDGGSGSQQEVGDGALVVMDSDSFRVIDVSQTTDDCS